MVLDTLKKVLRNFGTKVVTEAKSNLSKQNVSGRLSKSIRFEDDVALKQSTIKFFMLDYGKYQDLGVRGTKKGKSVGKSYYGPSYPEYKYTDSMPPPSVFDQWVIRKGKFNKIIRDNRGRFVDRSADTVGFRKSLTFLIARSIYGKGIKPTLFFTKPYTKYFKNLPQQVSNALGKDFDISVQRIFERK